MKVFKTTGFILLFSSVLLTGSIYDYSFTKIEGGTKTMTTCQGKKILIVILPIQQNASADSMLYCLDTLAAAHIANLAVIGIPSYEDGYTAAQQTQLKNWYRSKLGNYITISTGLYTRKTSGVQQHGLLKWLTTDTMNDHFNVDAGGPGYKFFVSASGDLYGVLVPQSKIGGPGVQRTLRIQ